MIQCFITVTVHGPVMHVVLTEVNSGVQMVFYWHQPLKKG